MLAHFLSMLFDNTTHYVHPLFWRAGLQQRSPLATHLRELRIVFIVTIIFPNLFTIIDVELQNIILLVE